MKILSKSRFKLGLECPNKFFFTGKEEYGNQKKWKPIFKSIGFCWFSSGGAALTAYTKLQYQDLLEIERSEITNSLLKYCELDTLAMVMIYEHFKGDLIK